MGIQSSALCLCHQPLAHFFFARLACPITPTPHQVLSRHAQEREKAYRDDPPSRGSCRRRDPSSGEFWTGNIPIIDELAKCIGSDPDPIISLRLCLTRVRYSLLLPWLFLHLPQRRTSVQDISEITSSVTSGVRSE